MSDRATVFQTTQVGVETVKGTTEPAIHRILAFSIEPKPMTPIKPFRNQGSKFVTDTFNPKEWTQADVKGEACYKSLTWLFSCILTTAVVTTPGGGTNSRLWTWTPNTYTEDTPVTLTVESGSSVGAERFNYGTLDTLAIRWTKDEVGISGSMFGQRLTEGATLTSVDQNQVWHVDIGLSSAGTFKLGVRGDYTATINYNDSAATIANALKALETVGTSDVTVTGTGSTGDPWVVTFLGALAGQHIVLASSSVSMTGGSLTLTEVTVGQSIADVTPKPIQPTEVQVFVGSQSDLSDLTLLDRAFEAEFSISNRFTMVMTLNSADPSYSAVVEKAPDVTATLLVEHDAASIAFMAELRARADKFCQIVATSEDFIEGSIPWELTVTFPFRFTESTRADKDDVWCSTYKLQPLHNSDLGYALRVTLQNELTTI